MKTKSKTAIFIALIVITLVVILFSSCKKDKTEPMSEEKPTEQVDRLKAVVNYSTSTTKPSNISNQQNDTTYYTITRNGKEILSKKFNWFTDPSFYEIEDMITTFNLVKGDVIVWKILNRTPNTTTTTSYQFAGGVTKYKADGTYNTLFTGIYTGYKLDSSNPDYKPNFNSFVTIWQHTID